MSLKTLKEWKEVWSIVVSAVSGIVVLALMYNDLKHDVSAKHTEAMTGIRGNQEQILACRADIDTMSDDLVTQQDLADHTEHVHPGAVSARELDIHMQNIARQLADLKELIQSQ